MMRELGLLTFARKLDEVGRSARLVLNPRHPFTTTDRPWPIFAPYALRLLAHQMPLSTMLPHQQRPQPLLKVTFWRR